MPTSMTSGSRRCATGTTTPILDVVLLAGWYHAISLVARTAGVALEPDAPGFEDYLTTPVRPPGPLD
jgi:hypothetical protein